MKKPVQIISMLLSIVLLAGCSGGTESYSNSIGNVVKPDINELTIYFPKNINDAWSMYMSDKYGISINVKTNESNSVKEDIKRGNLSGVVGMSDIRDIAELARANKILPLNDYLKDNKTWNSMPEEYRKQFEFDGKIYAIPSGYLPEALTRSYKTAWLEAAGADVPATLEELEQVCEKAAKTDPDGDKISTNNSVICDPFPTLPIPPTGLPVLSGAIGRCADIFAAFGIHLNITDPNAIAYNPVTGKFEDGLAKSEALPALIYLRNLYTNNGLSHQIFDQNCPTTQSGSLLATALGSTSTSAFFNQYLSKSFSLDIGDIGDIDDPLDDTYTLAAPLTGNYTENLMPCKTCNRCYVLPSSTKDPKQTVSFFVDMAFSSVSSFLDCFVGEPTTYNYKRNQGIIIADSKIAVQLVSPIEGMYEPESFMFFTTEPDDKAIRRSREIYVSVSEFTKKNLKSGKFYILPCMKSVPISQTYINNLSEINMAFSDTVFNALTNPNSDLQSLLNEYKIKMEKLQVNRILDEANMFIHTNP